MRAKSLIAFAAVTLVLLIGAVYAVVAQRGVTTVRTGGDPVFPDLRANINKAAEIDLVFAAGKLTIKREGQAWLLVEKQGYPVPFDNVRVALVALADLKFLEPKTKDPARYDRLQVEDIGPKATEAVSVTVKDEAGKTLASAIIGKRNESLYGKVGGGTYIRRTGEAQAWLAEGIVKLGVSHKDWVDKLIVSLKKPQVRRVAMTHAAAAESFVATKADDKQAHLALEHMPAGKKLKTEGEIDSIVEIMDGLDLDDVKKEADVQWPSPGDRFEFVTWDGLVVRGEVMSPKQYTYWAKFSADVAPDAKDPDKVRDEAAKINARVQGWAYDIAAGYGEKLSKKLPELFEEEKKSGS
jgi:hypothetical protein